MTYRTEASSELGRWKLAIIREGAPGATYGEPGGDPGEDELVAVVVNGDQALAERICTLLNATPEFGRWCEQETGEKCCGLEALEEPTRETPTGPAHTPDVDHIRGAAEALALVHHMLDRACPPATIATVAIRRLLDRAAAELGVSEDAPSGPLGATEAAEQASGVGPDTPRIVHLIRDGYTTTGCCYRTPSALPLTDRITTHPDVVTCGIVPREPEREADR